MRAHGQASIAASRRAREKGEDVAYPLTFRELSQWNYTDGLAGLPPSLRRLDGTAVELFGYLLPIDEGREYSRVPTRRDALGLAPTGCRRTSWALCASRPRARSTSRPR